MNPIFAVALLPVLLAGTSPQPSEQHPIAPNLEDPATDILGLDEDRHDRMTVPVTIDGSGPYDFMIDTGSQATAVTDLVLSKVGLAPAGTATLVGMASTREVNMVEIARLGVANRTITDFEAPVLERAHLGADGIIGLDSLQDFRVLIDFRKGEIAIADAHKSKGSRGFEIIVRAKRRHGQLLITNALVDGVRATVIIDTGGQATLGNFALRDKIRQRHAQAVTTTDVNGVTVANKQTLARTVVIGEMTFTDFPITYADAPAFAALGLADEPVLSLGMQHLRVFDRIAIDFSRRRVMFDLPSVIRIQRNLRRARATRL